ncbi:hypothetical protein BJV74DRAFT_575526 [Russula compacta]|nr:hypothetical protein BJV74DRAFT_575526 [Russula compacta]
MTMRNDGLTNNGTFPLSLEARDEDYDTYLFWPSLSNGVESSKESFEVTHQRPVPPLSDHDDYCPGWDTAPSSPLSLASPSDFRFPPPGEDPILNNGLPEIQSNSIQEKDSLPRYSSMFRMGLLLIVRDYSLGPFFSHFLLQQRAARHVDRAVQSVGITLRKTKKRGRDLERAHTFDR